MAVPESPLPGQVWDFFTNVLGADEPPWYLVLRDPDSDGRFLCMRLDDLYDGIGSLVLLTRTSLESRIV